MTCCVQASLPTLLACGSFEKNSLGRSHGFEDEKQGNLFFKILEVVDIKRPPVLLLENVKNLKSHDKGNTWRVIEGSLIDRDYVVVPEKSLTPNIGYSQHRERVLYCLLRQENIRWRRTDKV